MNSAQVAAVVTWAAAAAFGGPTILFVAYLMQRWRLPASTGLFPMYDGPWAERYELSTFVALLIAFLAVMLVGVWAAWRVWNGSKKGALLVVALLPVEAAFWIGFALPIAWVLAVLRGVALARAWKTLT